MQGNHLHFSPGTHIFSYHIMSAQKALVRKAGRKARREEVERQIAREVKEKGMEWKGKEGTEGKQTRKNSV